MPIGIYIMYSLQKVLLTTLAARNIYRETSDCVSPMGTDQQRASRLYTRNAGIREIYISKSPVEACFASRTRHGCAQFELACAG